MGAVPCDHGQQTHGTVRISDAGLRGATAIAASGSHSPLNLHRPLPAHRLLLPCLPLQVTAGNNGLVYCSTHGFPGTINDKTIVRADRHVARVREEDLYTNFEYSLYDVHGQSWAHKGAYLLCDGGVCPKHAALTAPPRPAPPRARHAPAPPQT